ncbi:tRNA (adenosine(37)-N6)-threonylcarbamoyltransferase complex ATPase subunit type 1 TsaE [Pigmentibacter ruber]|uniref:tRNA (adenosine(37)-N6)-threonylcarbamoyltransferase complex ATPase subunit type 1 TsaE n=1 Tax=Pigmentibacter ruber TaxID=2683196 RepID=UPI00131D3B47|nr:tRNA (adenosine(37)-N6)-threonylcarbamoyltransferase complex ATPase subunit type 1 TsaE [Pigmentibacter ruber]
MEQNFKKDLKNFFDNMSNKNEAFNFLVNLENLDFIAKEINQFLQAGDWIFLDGDLGTGKTTFVKKLLEFWNSNEKGSSPTFSILNVFQLDNSKNKIKKVIHLDLYRIKTGKELIFLGLENEFSQNNSICIFEWPYNVEVDEYNSFFNVTGCQRPNRIFEISLELNSVKNSRFYSIKKISL